MNVEHSTCFSISSNNFDFEAKSFHSVMKTQCKLYFYGEFDLGSGRTLAACLIHASRAQEAD